jgi:RimJ/RimL family protein N-acetyltransferase
VFDIVRGIYCSLRRPNLDDIDTMVRWMSDPFLTRTVFDSASFEGGAEQQAMSWIEANAAVYGGDSLVALVCTRSSGAPIGMVLLANIDWKSRTADLRYLIGEAKYRNSVFGPEMVLLGLQLAFDGLNLRKLYGYILSGNTESLRLAEFGGESEGVLKNYLRTSQGWNDYHMFAMFQTDFRALLERHRTGVLRRHFSLGLIT